MSLARDWIAAALSADLTQNELKAFLAIFHQTLCYGKTHDALTLKRVAQLAHVRADRLTPALRAIAEKGLIEVEAHAVFGQIFSIPQALLSQYPSGFFVPALPKNRSTAPKTGADLTEKRETITAINPTALNPTTPAATPPTHATGMQAELRYPADWTHTQRQRAQHILDGLNPLDARDCLTILTQALQTPQRVKSPLGFLYQLAQAARHGTLDRSGLTPIANATPPSKPTHAARIAAIQAEIAHITGLYALANTALPVTEQRHLQRLKAELRGFT